MGWNSSTTSHWPWGHPPASPGHGTLLKVRTWTPKGRELWAQHLPGVSEVRSQFSWQVPPPPVLPTGCGIRGWAALTPSTSSSSSFSVHPKGSQRLQIINRIINRINRIITAVLINAEITSAVTQVNQAVTRTISASPSFFFFFSPHPCGFKLSLRTGYERRRHPKILLQIIKHPQLKASWKLSWRNSALDHRSNIGRS